MEMKLIARRAGYIERDENKVDDNLIAYYTDTHSVPRSQNGTPTSLPGLAKCIVSNTQSDSEKRLGGIALS